MELNKEILKGHIDTLILAVLANEDSYGYKIAKNVKDRTTFELKDGTMYISLKRLESQGYIKSYYNDDKGNQGRRKYYNITKEGRDCLVIKAKEWYFVQNIIDELLEGALKNEKDR